MDVIVVTGSEPLAPTAVAQLPSSATVIAADGGLDHALAAGLEPSALIGDLDSVTAASLEWAERHATIEHYDTDKDRTDTELALATAVDLNPDRLVLITGAGDRLDHTLAVIGALGHQSLTSIPIIEAWWGTQRFRMLHGPGRTVIDDLESGTVLSLLAAHGPCEGVTIEGVRWPLDRFYLEPLVGLGISNEVTAPPVRASVTTGVLTIAIGPADAAG